MKKTKSLAIAAIKNFHADVIEAYPLGYQYEMEHGSHGRFKVEISEWRFSEMSTPLDPQALITIVEVIVPIADHTEGNQFTTCLSVIQEDIAKSEKYAMGGKN